MNRHVILRHELRTYLNQIQGYAEILRDDYGENKDLLPDVFTVLRHAAVLRDLVQQHFGGTGEQTAAAEDVKNDLAMPLYDVIGAARGIQEGLGAGSQGWEDAEAITVAAGKMLDTLDIYVTLGGEAGRPIGGEGDSGILPILTRESVVEGSLLVVDDDPVNLDLLGRRLRQMGYSVKTADGGRRALEMLGAERFDALILDVRMPDIDGYRVLSIVKEDDTLRNLPVIIMSALHDMEAISHSIALGADDYLLKNFDPVILRARVGTIIEKKKLEERQQAYLDALNASQAVLDNELREAANYVRGLIPDPIEGPVSTRWFFRTSKALGGDCLGHDWIDDHRFAFFLLDVSGHGIGAALLSVSITNVLRAASSEINDLSNPGGVLSTLNRIFPMETQNDMYFSIWFGVYDKSEGIVTYAAGGAPPAILMKSEGGHELLDTDDLIVGIEPTYVYENHSVRVGPGDSLYLFSDGLYEIEDDVGGTLEVEELLPYFERADRFPSLEKMADLILQEGERPYFEDDASCLEIRFSGS